MVTAHETPLSRRERQIMDVLHEKNPRDAKEIQALLPDAPGYSAVRALLARMVEKDVISFTQDGAKYLYQPVQNPKVVQRSAVARLIKTFFKGSKLQAVTALLDAEGEAMDAHEIAELERKIASLKKNKTMT